jgi:hypothetical protein
MPTGPSLTAPRRILVRPGAQDLPKRSDAAPIVHQSVDAVDSLRTVGLDAEAENLGLTVDQVRANWEVVDQSAGAYAFAKRRRRP